MSRDDRYYGSTSSGKTRTRSPFVADRDSQSGGLFQTGQGGRPVLPPISSGFPTSRSPAPGKHAGQYFQRVSPARRERRWSNPSPQKFICYDDLRYDPAPPSSRKVYTLPARAPQSLPADIYNPRGYHSSTSSSVRRDEGWPSSATYLSGPFPMAYSDKGSNHSIAVPSTRDISFPAPSCSRPSYSQAQYNSAPGQYANQYPRRVSPGRSKCRRSNSSPQKFTYYDDPKDDPTAPSLPHEVYMSPARASQSLPGNIYDPHRYPISRPSPGLREEGCNWPSVPLEPSIAALARNSSKKEVEEHTITLSRKDPPDDAIFPTSHVPSMTNHKQVKGKNLTSTVQAYPAVDRSGIYVDSRRENAKECCCCIIQ